MRRVAGEARGGAGVSHALELFRSEITTAMALTGCTDVAKAGREMLIKAD